MADYFWLALWSFGMSLCVAYSLWCWVRPVFLRQDLFAVRDALWLKAKALNGFDDPAYQESRETLNALIYAGHVLSLGLVALLMKSSAARDLHVRPTSANPELEREISRAEDKAIGRVWLYIARDRFPSFCYWLVVLMLRRILRNKRSAKKLVQVCVKTSQPQRLRSIVNFEQRALRGAPA